MFAASTGFSGKPRTSLGGTSSMKRTVRRAVLVIFATACLLFSMHVAQTANPTAKNRNASQPTRDASTLFAKNCATCHGKDGEAKTFKAKFNHARDLTNPQWQ